ncbi:major facilitator superfamily domain-containing protein [Pseudomassariella vexata]|uniref:Major facilitator superfamily domain-containing protein n=1 Tax=Pseudomassariella vexata TaxID=1141098 RepID=A0A1Y2DST2_9PEZI|nr:major facilitator superfamily domain-containing protein [Pseudomassariella vexata]ORY62307.1 major facilitator superfamily domain-containing protein [Pseudomassariella vexata]
MQFYAVFPGLCLAILLTALESSILGIALPSITASLDSGALYIWALNGYYLAVAVVQPVYGQCADILGRRIPMTAALVSFTLGSGISGGAVSIEMLVAGRVIQGVGGGGIMVMVYIIIADLVPLRFRQKYTAITMSFFALGMFVGPIIGGVIVTKASWRWIFYLNVPIGGVALILVSFFLKLKHDRRGATLANLKRIDWLGNGILTATVASILIALTWGGTLYSWKSSNVLAPFLVGLAGLVIFALHQVSFSPSPITPSRLFSHRASLIGFAISFLHGVILTWVGWMLAAYFQALKECTPLQTGVNVLALAILFPPSGIIGGLVIAKTGRYKPLLIAGLALIPLGAGCFTTLNPESTTGMGVGFQILLAVGLGLTMQAALPAIQATLPEEDVALATAAWGFVRSFGFIWGAAIPAAVFNSRVDSLLGQISDPGVRQLLARGGAYEHATRKFITSFNDSPELKRDILNLYTLSLRETWQVLIGFAAVAFLLSLCIPEVPLRKTLETKFGLKEGGEDCKSGKGHEGEGIEG